MWHAPTTPAPWQCPRYAPRRWLLSFFLSQFLDLLTKYRFPHDPLNVGVSAILMDHKLHEIMDLQEEQYMQTEEQAHNVSAEVRVTAEPFPQHADAKPLVQTSTNVPRRRLTTRELARRRRQRLLELLQQPAKQPASQ